MKNIFTYLLVWLLVSPALAQTSDPVRQKLDAIFTNLDKSQVPTARLLDAAVPLANVPGFDGTLRDSARTDLDGFRLLLATAQSARLAGPEPLPALTDFNQAVKAAAPTTPTGAIPIAVQYISYARLRSDAESAGLVTLQNEQLYDVAGRSQSPYQTAVLFAAAPERAYTASATVSLVLRSSLYVASGAPAIVPAPYLDFGDGQGYRAATWDQPLSVTYGTTGMKRVKVKLLYGTEIRESWFDLTVLTRIAATYRPAAGSATARYNPGSPDTPLDPPTASIGRLLPPTMTPPLPILPITAGLWLMCAMGRVIQVLLSLSL